MTLTLPWPPSVNTYWRAVNGRNILSRKGRTYRELAKRCCLWQQIGGMGTSRLMVRIDAYPPDRRRRDLDNIPKAVLDALGHSGVYVDDSQIDHLTIVRQKPAGEDARVEITLEAY